MKKVTGPLFGKGKMLQGIREGFANEEEIFGRTGFLSKRTTLQDGKQAKIIRINQFSKQIDLGQDRPAEVEPPPQDTRIARLLDDTAGAAGPQRYDMDSGYLEFDLDTEAEQGGYLEQNLDTLSLYDRYDEQYFEILYPKDGVDNGNVPPSFATKVKNAFITGWAGTSYIGTQKAGSYTGKLKWLIAGKYGLKSSDPLWRNVGEFTRRFVSNGRLSGEGIFTDASGRYWHINIGSTGYTGTATLLQTPLQFLVKQAKTAGIIGEELVQLETHALAVAQKTSTVKPIAFGGEEPAGKPLGYGWHFNTGGNSAALVAHSGTGTLYEFEAKLYEMSINASNPTSPSDTVFNATVSLSESSTWLCSPQTSVWGTDESEEGRKQCVYPKALTGAGEASNATIYVYYDDSDELKEVKYSATSDEDAEEPDVCGTTGYTSGPIEIYMQNARSWVLWVGERLFDTVVVDGQTFEGKTGKRYYQQVTAATTTEIPDYYQEGPFTCGSGQALKGYYFEPCSAARKIWPGSPATPNCYIYGHQQYWRMGYQFAGIQKSPVSGIPNDATGRIAVIIPFDCANGVTILNSDLYHHKSIATTSTEGIASGIWKTQWWGHYNQCYPGIPCDKEGESYDSGKLQSGSTAVGWQVLDYSTYFENTINRYYFHEGGHFNEADTEQGTTQAELVTPYDDWLYPLLPGTCVGFDALIYKGTLTDCAKATANINEPYDIDGDFPEDATAIIGWT